MRGLLEGGADSGRVHVRPRARLLGAMWANNGFTIINTLRTKSLLLCLGRLRGLSTATKTNKGN